MDAFKSRRFAGGVDDIRDKQPNLDSNDVDCLLNRYCQTRKYKPEANQMSD